MKELEQRRWEPQYGVETIDHVESCTWTTLETSRNNPEAVFFVHQTTNQITMKAPVISISRLGSPSLEKSTAGGHFTVRKRIMLVRE